MTAEPTESRLENPRRTTLAGVRRVFAFTMLSLTISGCASMKKGPVAQNVVSSREQSLAGMEAIQRGQWEQAERLFGSAIEACPTDERTRVRYADVLWRRGATAEAIQQMEEAVQLSGGDSRLQVRLGEMYLALGQLDSAGVNAERAIHGNRQLAAAWALRGDVQVQRRELQEALASYHRALTEQPHYPQIQLAAARIYGQLDQPQRSLTTIEALAEQYQPGREPQELLYLQGLTLKQLGHSTDAVQCLLAASQRGEPSAEIFYQLAEAQMLAGEHRGAQASVAQALDLDPRHTDSRRLLSQLQNRQPNAVSLRQ